MEYLNDYLKITGGINASSHKGTKCNDLAYTVGPLIAFEDCKVVKTYSVGTNSNNTNSVWFTTLDSVDTPKGRKQVTFRCAHMNYADYKKLGVKIGKVFKKGEVCYMPGTGGTSAPHIHIEFGFGTIKGSGWYKVSNGNWTISTTQGSCYIYEALFITKETEIAKTGDYRDDYNWIRKINEVVEPIEPGQRIMVIHKIGVNIRQSLSFSKNKPTGKVLKYMRVGSRLEIIEMVDGLQADGYQWVKVQYQGIIGYSQYDSRCYSVDDGNI